MILETIKPVVRTLKVVLPPVWTSCTLAGGRDVLFESASSRKPAEATAGDCECDHTPDQEHCEVDEIQTQACGVGVVSGEQSIVQSVHGEDLADIL
jgi:hypothetical protein